MKDGKTAKLVREFISKQESEVLFGLKDLVDLGNPQAVLLELSRLCRRGVIRRARKGKYYLPRSTQFGDVGPSENEIVLDILKENGGYIAGFAALNRVGLTTQVPAEILIRGARSNRTIQLGKTKIRCVSAGQRDSTNSQLTDILEAIRLIKVVPDGDPAQTLKMLKEKINNLTNKNLSLLVDISLDERPASRALLGALLKSQKGQLAKKIKTSLNPVTKYKLPVDLDWLPTKTSWGFV